MKPDTDVLWSEFQKNLPYAAAAERALLQWDEGDPGNYSNT